MKRFFLILSLTMAFLLTNQQSSAQFYYKDLIIHQGNLQQYQLHKNNRVQSIRINSFEGNGDKAEGFNFNQQYNATWSQFKTIAEIENSGRNVVINSYNSQGLLYRTTDSSNGNYTVYEYGYDSLSRLIQIQNYTLAIRDKNRSSEIHNWFYDLQGKPEKMERIRDKTDTMIYVFTKDSLGNIIEEQGFHKKVPGEKTYYYYDAGKKLTDIVRYNKKSAKLIPDYMFDYDEKGMLMQMVNIPEGGGQSFTWIYKYNEQGLKEEESCYLAQKKLAGRMAYQYMFKK
jgi:hypothetical protein